MYVVLFNLLLQIIPLIIASSSSGGGGGQKSQSSLPPANDLGLIFSHTVNKREDLVIVYFDVSNATLKEYRYYYYDFRPFGSYSHSEFLPRQRLIDTHNSLRIIGLHEDDYVVCLSFIDEYENVFKPRYACYEFTLGEKLIGSHHGGKSGYLAPLLFAVAFIIHVFIAIVHHIKAQNYAQKLLHRFRNVTPKSGRRKINVKQSMEVLGKELDHPHLSASVQRRLSRVSVDVDHEHNHGGGHFIDDSNDELPLYTLPHHNRKFSSSVMEVIPEYDNANTIASVSSVRHLIDTTPWTKRPNRAIRNGQLPV